MRRPVSCYALFKWWLLLSQHPSCLCDPTSFVPLSLDLGALADGLGSFPLGREAYPTRPISRGTSDGIRSLIGFGNLVGPLAHSVLYLRHIWPEAYPKVFSGRTSYRQV